MLRFRSKVVGGCGQSHPIGGTVAGWCVCRTTNRRVRRREKMIDVRKIAEDRVSVYLEGNGLT